MDFQIECAAMQRSAVLDFVIASVIGAILLIIVGFFVHADGLSFGYWLRHSASVWAWALTGIFIGSGLRYLAR